MFRSRGIKEPKSFDQVLEYPDTTIIYNERPGQYYQKTNRLCRPNTKVYYNVKTDHYKVYYEDYKTYCKESPKSDITETRFIVNMIGNKIYNYFIC